MPTQKALKATRKLKRKQTKVNARRRNVGKNPLSFKHFYGTSHKRNRSEFESRNKDQDTETLPHKKRKFNNDTKTPRREPQFGFGAPINETEPEYQRFLADINESDSDEGESTESEDNDTIQTALETRDPSKLALNNNQIKKQIHQHQSALDSLKSADPEFYQHLQEMDGNLLSFGDNDEFNLGELGDIDAVVNDIKAQEMKQNMDEIENDDTSNKEQNDVTSFMDEDEDSDDDNDEEEDVNEEEDVSMDAIHANDDDLYDDIEDDEDMNMFEFDLAELKEIIKDMEENRSVDALKRILNGFCSFIALTMDDDKKDKKKKKISKQSVAVANNPAFQHLLHYALTKLAAKMVFVLDISSKEQLQASRLRSNRRYKQCRGALSRYFKFLYVFFKSVDDASMQRLYLIHCREVVYMIINLQQSLKRLYIKYVTKLWASTTPAVRIDAFLMLYEAGKRMHDDGSELLSLFKFMYASYVRVCKRVSASTMPGIQFMMNCMVEMYALNPVLSYKDAFKRLRAIAFHVKQSIQIMAKHETTAKARSNKRITGKKEVRSAKLKRHKLETVQSVYNWRFINIVLLWSKILASHANRKNSDLHLLYYPFVQICCSVLTLSRSAAYDPARIKIIQALCYLIGETQKSQVSERRIYVPLAPYLISIINNPAFSKKTKAKKKNKEDEKEEDDNNNEKNKFELKYRVKIGATHFNTFYLHESLMKAAVKWMSLYFSYYSHSISFPEIVFPTQVFLREFLSNSNVTNTMKSAVKLLSIKLKENSNWITIKRKNVQFSPKDFEKCNAFLASERLRDVSPLAKFVKSKQFETMLVLQKERNKENENVNNNNNDEQNKKQKKKKKKKNKNKMKEKQINSGPKQVTFDLEKQYKNELETKDVQLTGLGDVIKEFELSDDDD